MHTTEMLDRLGLGPTDRAVVLHADDIGMCEATVTAYRQTVSSPVVSAASAMVPCAWFPALARLCAELDTAPDLGVHLTLNSEWVGYRWRPLTPAGHAVLTDESGYLPSTAAQLHGRPGIREAVVAELSAQVDHARALGVDVTHLDSHMLTLYGPELIGAYVELSARYRLPATLLRHDAQQVGELCNIPQSDAAAVADELADAERQGLVPFDAWVDLPLGRPENRRETATRLLDSLPAGLSVFIMHPAAETDELKAIAPDWQARVADFELCRDDKWIDIVDRSGVTVVGMQAVRDALFGVGAVAASVRAEAGR
ncbi:polysaccharide deacetylase family protein [Micromonospora sp. NPDC006766]|uniref:polysaccharide deacetylase family protein n=1 Tax=Micromonospora sp. NPDC006766 TaxID=3154778 RepID=UPI0033D848A9